MGNHTLEAIDLQSDKCVLTIPYLSEPQGRYFDAATNHLYVARGLDAVPSFPNWVTVRRCNKSVEISVYEAK